MMTMTNDDDDDDDDVIDGHGESTTTATTREGRCVDTHLLDVDLAVLVFRLDRVLNDVRDGGRGKVL